MQSRAGVGLQQNEQAKAEPFRVSGRREQSSCPIQRSTQDKAEEKQCIKKEKKHKKTEMTTKEKEFEKTSLSTNTKQNRLYMSMVDKKSNARSFLTYQLTMALHVETS